MAKAKSTYKRGLTDENELTLKVPAGTGAALRSAMEKLSGGEKARAQLREAAKKAGADQVPLYVMVAPEQLERFKTQAKNAGMSLREYVTNAVEAFSARMSTTNDELGEMLGVANATSDQLRSMVSSQQVRLSTLETRVDALQKRLDRQWGAGQPDRDGPPDPPAPVYEQDSFFEGLNEEADRMLGRDEKKKR